MKAVLLLLALVVALPATAKDRPALALTFDDLPVHGPAPRGETQVSIGKAIADALVDGQAGPVYGFINQAKSEAEPDAAPMIDNWRKAGLPLGNHGWSHADLDKLSAEAFGEEIVRNEPTLTAKMPQDNWRWFRFPYLHEGQDPAKRAAVRTVLAKRGYRIAAVTMDFGDWMWTAPYARCMAKGDSKAVAWLESSYLQAARESAALARAQAKAVHGRDIPYVLLMHVGALDARMMPRLLKQYRKDGFRFVSLPEAQADPSYAADNDPSLPAMPTLEQQAHASGKPMPKVTAWGPQLDAVCK